MEEATELFALQQAMLRAAQSALPPPPSAPGSFTTAAPPPASMAAGPGGVTITEDTLWTGLLFFGAGAGILAAVLRRAGLDRGETTGSSR